MYPSAHHRQTQARRAWEIGRRLLEQGKVAGALERFDVAHRLQPKDRLYLLNLAQAYLMQDQPEVACGFLERALRRDPSDTTVLMSLLQCLEVLGRDEEIVSLAGARAEALMTRDAWNCVGLAQVRLGKHADAASTWMKALAFDITDARLHVRLAYALYELGLKAEAVESLRTAVTLGVGAVQGGCIDMLRLYEREVCDWQDSHGRMREWQESLRSLSSTSVVERAPFCHAVLLDDPGLQLQGARAQARFLRRRIEALPARVPVSRERIRVGYLSSDFYNHATSRLIMELLEQHDRTRFEIYVYSYGVDDAGPERVRIAAAVEHFVDLRQVAPLQMARRIRDDGIDVLVDLKGYTKEARPLVMAARPAPVQVSYLGYPGTMGADFIDYIIGDPWVTPLEHAHHYSEKIAQLPGCYQCNDATRPLPVAPSRTSQGLPEDALVLCGFNQLYKISPEVFDVWCRLLHELPQAVLWLLKSTEAGAQSLHHEARLRGVDPARIVFAPLVRNFDNLSRLACADLFIDTWPCNGHTSASDALWAGLPVVTISGETFASRVAGSLLRASGTPELVCNSVEMYLDRVIKLARDADLRLNLRKQLESGRMSSRLFDGRQRAREIEVLYEQMWARAVAGLPPSHLPAINRLTSPSCSSALV